MRKAASIIVVATALAHAQPMRLDASRLRAIEAQVANAYATSATEADFTELRRQNPNQMWSGHATFTKSGFVLDYANPPGRRVVSDMTTTHVIDPTVTPATTTFVAQSSVYNRMLRLMIGVERPKFESGARDATSYYLRADGTHFGVDMVTSRIFGVTTLETSTGSPDDLMSKVAMSFTNIRVVAAPIATARMTSALHVP